LLHISKKLKVPSLTIYLNDDAKYSKETSMSVLNEIGETSLSDITKSMRIFYDPSDYDTTIDEDRELLKIYKVFQEIDECMNDVEDGSNWVIRFEFDKQRMMEKDITMDDVYQKVNTKYDKSISCVYSDDNSNKLIFRVRLLKNKKKDASDTDNMNQIKLLAKNIREEVLLKGIQDIKNVSMYKNKNNYVYNNGSFEMKDEWVLDTNGVNLLEVMKIPYVDKTRTISNDIYEVYSIFGIEAAKQVLLKEIREVIDSAGSYVNFRHLSLLVDTMTYRGYLMSIDRFGINRGNIGPLAKCSFEEATDQLFKASIFGEIDKLNGVSSNIMMGQIPPCGTGMTDVLLDETQYMNVEGKEEEELEDIEKWGGIDVCDNEVNIDFVLEDEESFVNTDSLTMNQINMIEADTPNSSTYGPTSPTYNPTSPTYNPTSPTYNPTSPIYNPTSPAYNPTSP